MYSKLNQNEDGQNFSTLDLENEESSTNSTNNRNRKRAYIFLCIIGAATCGLIGYVVHPNNHPFSTFLNSQNISTSEFHCGNSSTEARALGCVFDLLTNNWMPEYCSDPNTDSEYREWVYKPDRLRGSWAYFSDENGEHQVESEEQLSNLVGSHIYTTTENHLAHCAFLARRMHRLVTGEIAAVAHNTFAHTMHCTSALLKAVGIEGEVGRAEIHSTFDVGIVSCVV